MAKMTDDRIKCAACDLLVDLLFLIKIKKKEVDMEVYLERLMLYTSGRTNATCWRGAVTRLLIKWLSEKRWNSVEDGESRALIAAMNEYLEHNRREFELVKKSTSPSRLIEVHGYSLSFYS